MGELKQKTAKGAIWVLLEQTSVQGLNFVLGIILARLLSPADYGTVALVTIFLAVATVLVNSGFGQALVQKKNADDLDFTSVFYVGTAIAVLLYVVLFFGAPFIARYYHVPELTLILRILALNILFYSVNSVQNAELYRNMRFDLTFRISLVVTVVSGVVGVMLALAGCGVWALVWSSVISGAAGVVVRGFIIRWRPKLAFSFIRVRGLFHYGWKMMVTGLLSTFIMNLHGVLIGRCYSRADLAMINRGQSIPNLLKNNIQTSLIEATFPAASKLQGDNWHLREALRKVMIVSTFVLFPLMTLVALTAPKFILFLYGEKWLPCVPYAQLTCIGGMTALVSAVNELAFQSTGRSDVFMKVAILGNVISVLLLIFVLPQSILLWLAVNVLGHGPLKVLIVTLVNRRLLDFGLWMQMRDLMATILLTAVVGSLLALSNLIPVASSSVALFACLACQCAGFTVFYLGLAFLFKVRALREVASIVLPKLLPRYPICSRLADYLGVKIGVAA